MHQRPPARGFTLIEMMITVAILGILAAVAYPAYTDQIRKGRRGEARAALLNLLTQQERYLTQQNTYLEFTPGASAGTFKTFSGETLAKSSHALGARACQPVGSVTPTLRDCIEVYAELRTGYTDPEAGTLAIDSQGRKRCTGTNSDRCWK
jgi:type IV pilus assembly protein PilE